MKTDYELQRMKATGITYGLLVVLLVALYIFFPVKLILGIIVGLAGLGLDAVTPLYLRHKARYSA